MRFLYDIFIDVWLFYPQSGSCSHFYDHSFYHFIDSNIYEHDQLRGTSYIVTLENYFFSHLNRSETAKALLIHRNTLYLLIDTEKKSRNRDSNKFTT
ncbi:hypothetical protein GQA12_10135 [Paenibacillus alvei]|nr:hypothetical protein [Paenibacillus alvei]